MLVIKRKIDGIVVGTVVDGMSPEQEIKLNSIPNFGGVLDDYEAIEYTPDDITLQPVAPQIDAEKLALYEAIAGLDERLRALEGGGE